VIECVRAVLLTPAGRLLLIRRTWPGATPYRVFPGGHVEPDDPGLRAALVREIREETGAERRSQACCTYWPTHTSGSISTWPASGPGPRRTAPVRSSPTRTAASTGSRKSR
jgi:8-oxo-dGTP pyrophosphatase MutT (NUDIX family)